MKHQTYLTPESRTIKFELCDSLLFLPQSQAGGDQLSGKKDYADEASGWNSESWDIAEEK